MVLELRINRSGPPRLVLAARNLRKKQNKTKLLSQEIALHPVRWIKEQKELQTTEAPQKAQVTGQAWDAHSWLKEQGIGRGPTRVTSPCQEQGQAVAARGKEPLGSIRMTPMLSWARLKQKEPKKGESRRVERGLRYL